MRFWNVVNFNKIPSIGFVPESSASAPSSPVVGQLWTDTSVTPRLLRVWDGAVWGTANHYFGTAAGTMAEGNDSRIVGAQQTSAKNAANGYAGLDAGTKLLIAHIPTGQTGTTVPFGNDARFTDQRVPTDGSVTGGAAGSGVKLAQGTITDANVAVANKDGAVGTPSLRTIGTGAQQAMAGNRTLDSISAPVAAVGMGGFKITNLGAPTVGSDAARLSDVQAATAGIDIKPSVRAASTGNVVVASGLVSGSIVDGVTLATGDRVLLKSQSTASENGSYVVPAAGAASRTDDIISANTFWFVEEGTANADTSWMVTTNGSITLGTTPLTIAQFGAPGSVTGTADRITVTGNAIDIASTYAGQASINTVGTVTTGVWNGTDVAVADGGTGSSTPAGARSNLGASQAGYRSVITSALVAGTPLTITHNLNTDNCIAQVRDATTGEYVYLDIIDAPSTPNTLTVTAAVAISANALDIVIIPV